MPETDPYFQEIYNKKILRKLRKKFGPIHQHHVDLTISSKSMLDLMDKMTKKKRRGEVVMVIPDKRGCIWLHTKDFYNKNVYRLMTGGLDPGEKPHSALVREAKEETGFAVKIDRCLASITYNLKGQNGSSQPFVSYVFLTKPASGEPNPIDGGEAISGFMAVPVAELGEVADILRQQKGNLTDWGIFRAVAHDVVHELLG